MLSSDFEKNKCKLWTLQPDTATTEPGTYCPVKALFLGSEPLHLKVTPEVPWLLVSSRVQMRNSEFNAHYMGIDVRYDLHILVMQYHNVTFEQ